MQPPGHPIAQGGVDLCSSHMKHASACLPGGFLEMPQPIRSKSHKLFSIPLMQLADTQPLTGYYPTLDRHVLACRQPKWESTMWDRYMRQPPCLMVAMWPQLGRTAACACGTFILTAAQRVAPSPLPKCELALHLLMMGRRCAEACSLVSSVSLHCQPLL